MTLNLVSRFEIFLESIYIISILCRYEKLKNYFMFYYENQPLQFIFPEIIIADVNPSQILPVISLSDNKVTG